MLVMCGQRTADKPLQPQNVQLAPVDKGLRLSWDPPNELDGRPVDSYTIGYGKSMKTLTFLKVDKDRRSEVLEDVEPGVLHFVKMSTENKEGMSKPVYRAETPGGGEWVKLDGFAVMGGTSANTSSLARLSPTSDNQPKHDPVVRTGAEVNRALRPSGLTSARGQRIRRPIQSSSGPRQPERTSAGTPMLDQRSHQHHQTQPQADQRNRRNPKLASESVYVVSLQAQRATERRAPNNRPVLTKKAPPEPEEYEAKDISVRVISPQSVLISWVDPAIEMEKVLPGGARYYTVKYREKGESARWEHKDTTQRKLLIDTLSADGMYEFSVRISQGENHGKWSVSVFQRTPESAPSGPPENFNVKPLRGKGTAVTATWDPPEVPNGKIQVYIMSYAPAMKPFGMKTVTYRGSTTSAIVDGLKAGDRYIFKIRATNRRGQGPHTKAFSVAMPVGTASSAASSPTLPSKPQGGHKTSPTPSRTSKQDSDPEDDINLQTEDVTEELTTTGHTTSAPTAIKRTRPLSQTRSYHSVFSDVRSSLRNRATNQRGSNSSARVKGRETEREALKKEYKTTEPTPAERKEEKLTNEAVEEKKDAVSPTPEEKDYGRGKVLSNDEISNPSLKTDISSSEGLLSSSKAMYPLRKTFPGRSVNSGRRPFTRVPSFSRSQPKTKDAEKESSSSSSSPSHRQESAAIRKDHMVTNYPMGKNTYNQTSVIVAKPFTPTPDQHIENPQTEAPSTSKDTVLTGRGYGYGRRKQGVLSRDSLNGRVLNVLRKTGSGSTSESILPTEQKTKEMSHTNEETETEPTSSPPVISTTHFSKEDLTEKDNYDQTPPPPPSRTNPFVNRHRSRFGTGTGSISRFSSPRADRKFHLRRTGISSSIGAGRPILGGSLSRTASGTSAIQETDEDSKTPSTLYPLKNGVEAGLLKPSVPNRSSILGGSRNPITPSSNPSFGGGTDSSNDHEEDYLYKGSKENESKKVPDPTPAPKATTTTTTTSAPSRAPQGMFPRRSIIGSHGRVRSPLLTNRQTGSGFPLRAQPAQNTQITSSNPDTSSSSSLSQPNHRISTARSVSAGGTGIRTRYPSRSDPFRGRTSSGDLKPSYGDSKNGRPNLTSTSDKESSISNENTKANGQRHITGPDGAKWVVDLDKGVLMNENGRILQDSQGRPRRVVLGEDGRTIFDHQGSPLVNQDGQTLFGHGRESQPVVNPKDKFLTLGGKPIIGLDRHKPRTTTTTLPPTTTIRPTTTTSEPTTLQTTTEMTTEESTTMVYPSCPPETFMMRDDRGLPILDENGILDCYPENELVWQTTLPPTKPPTLPPSTTTSTTPTTDPPIPEPETRRFNSSPTNEFDLTGKKRFTAPYVNFIKKDLGAPCSLTDALEYLQVDILEGLMNKDSLASNQKQPPKNKPQNITVVAMEGCHSFVILDWAIPLKDDMVSGYMVHSASYDDVLNNRWSYSTSSGTHLAVENLKPNSRYYFKVQAKNVLGLGPLSDTLTYVTESDDPLLIERPPGGEPIWIPFTFRYNPQHSACKGSQFVKRTWYRKFVGVVLCNSLRYKIFMGDGLKETFYSIADTFGHGEDHCQFVDSYLDGRTGSPSLSTFLPTAQGYYRSDRQEPVNFGPIGRRTPHPFVGWYECGVPIPGKW
ncbi:hypothetical protein DPEC_G00090810 [Dallia pectoralis]|uniref:Uncharacterized protein n=1 Tax=Dallia pectoralis TaxID=75939 RepID=A0ACC2H1C1_DALPE|nr:hypothetical protein DPEC_G00090810 [Dallia pectoralis]